MQVQRRKRRCKRGQQVPRSPREKLPQVHPTSEAATFIRLRSRGSRAPLHATAAEPSWPTLS